MEAQTHQKTNIAQPAPKKHVSELKIRNRRFKKLQELRKQGFFSEDSIKLRHPVLYYNYLGQHSQTGKFVHQSDCSLSQFLQKNLINMQYKTRLKNQLHQNMQEQKPQKNKSIHRPTQRQQSQLIKQIQNLHQKEEENEQMIDQKAQQLQNAINEEQIEIQEQNLIDHAQQLFLEGKIDSAYVNYEEIDNNSDNDELDQQNQDAQQKYFKAESNEDDELINKQYYTGIQDY